MRRRSRTDFRVAIAGDGDRPWRCWRRSYAQDAQSGDGDADRPTVWIELGGQIDHVTGQGAAFRTWISSDYPSVFSSADR